MKRYLAIIGIACLAQPALAGKLFELDWDRGARRHDGLGGCDVFGHEVLDKGISENHYVSRRYSAFVVVDLDQSMWGGILTCSADGPLDMTEAHLSVQVRASKDLTEHLGIVGFQLVDSDGTAARTEPDQLFRATTEFKPFLQTAVDITLVTERGDDGVLNLKEITKYGILFVDRDDTKEIITFNLDDFTATTPD